jgi:hypothetical protein
MELCVMSRHTRRLATESILRVRKLFTVPVNLNIALVFFVNNCKPLCPPNIATEWLALLLHILEVHGAETGYID